ncbi:MAG: 2Fe-2S iron-sulfur cluster-binding protein [Cyanobacteria bacterium P01_D01_bin.123]
MQTLPVENTQTILAAAIASGLDLSYSCSAGVRTTCVAQIKRPRRAIGRHRHCSGVTARGICSLVLGLPTLRSNV